MSRPWRWIGRFDPAHPCRPQRHRRRWQALHQPRTPVPAGKSWNSVRAARVCRRMAGDDAGRTRTERRSQVHGTGSPGQYRARLGEGSSSALEVGTWRMAYGCNAMGHATNAMSQERGDEGMATTQAAPGISNLLTDTGQYAAPRNVADAAILQDFRQECARS